MLRKNAPVKGKVALISGGGSGHEPLHGGFVGTGMLDAAAAGAVFTSPVPDQMLAATKAVDGGAGVIHIVKNYTGDVMNFKLAAEEAADEGIEVESVVTNDDVAVEDSLYTAGRRGTGATVLLEKIAGAKAEAGGSLAEVTAVARKVNDQARSFGVALTSCATPARAADVRHRPRRDGVRRRHPRRARPQAREGSLGCRDRRGDERGDPRRSRPSERLERARVRQRARRNTADRALRHLQRADQQLEERGLTATRSLVGNYITSLEMAGVSITILTLDDELTELWDAPVHTPALRWKA